MPRTRGIETEDDVLIGHRIRARRMQLGLSQTELGAAIGVTFQQIQKYEKGTNRVATSRLPQIAKILDIHLGYFFGLDEASMLPDSATIRDSIGLLANRHAHELLMCFASMAAPQRNALLEIARAVAANNAVVREREGTTVLPAPKSHAIA